MRGSAVAVPLPPGDVRGGARWSPEAVRTARYGLGITFASAIAFGIAWPMSFLAPLLVAGFLGGRNAVPLKGGIVFLVVVAVAALISFVPVALLDISFVFFAITGLGFFLVQYETQRGLHPLMSMWLTVCWILIPFLGATAPALSTLIAFELVRGVAVAVAITAFVALVLPDPEPPLAAGRGPAAPTRSDRACFENAARNTLVVMPLLVYLHLFGAPGDALVLAFVGMYAGNPAFAAGGKGGTALLVGNAIGGASAIVLYNALVFVPSFPFLLLSLLAATLLFGARVFSGRPEAALYKTGMTTLLIVVGTVSSSDTEASEKVYSRLYQILIVVLYLVVVTKGVESLWRRREA